MTMLWAPVWLAVACMVGHTIGFSIRPAKPSDMTFLVVPRTASSSCKFAIGKAANNVYNHVPNLDPAMFDFRDIRAVPAEGILDDVVVTGVRRPYELLRSLFLSRNGHSSKKDFASWYLEVEGIDRQSVNYSQTIGFGKQHQHIHDLTAHTLGLGELKLDDISKERLMADFSFIFITERLETSFKMFGATFECGEPEQPPHNNRGPAGKEEDPARVTQAKARFAANNPRDLKIYTLANEILDEMQANETAGEALYSQPRIQEARALRVRRIAAGEMPVWPQTEQEKKDWPTAQGEPKDANANSATPELDHGGGAASKPAPQRQDL